jgi:DNA-nicking Smr family endonuclease
MSNRIYRQNRDLSRDDHMLWTAVTHSIVPLRKPQKSQNQKKPLIEKSQTTVSETKIKRPSHVTGAMRADKLTAVMPPTPLARRIKRRIARGKQKIDGRIDLHGLTQAEAHAALLSFLRNAGADGARLVLVITGKGSQSISRFGENERGVLRRQVPKWLSLPEFHKLVIGFEDAHVAHGGEGALYIRVRRNI